MVLNKCVIMQRMIWYGDRTIKNVKKQITGQATEARCAVTAKVSHVRDLGIATLTL